MSNRDYLARRAAREDELASSAASQEAAAIHQAMANEYRRRLSKPEARRARPAAAPARLDFDDQD